MIDGVKKTMGNLPLRLELPETIGKYFGCRIAIVQVNSGETKEEAWNRNLAKHPEDIHASIKIFNFPIPPASR